MTTATITDNVVTATVTDDTVAATVTETAVDATVTRGLVAATESTAGAIEIATAAEAQALTSTNTALVPAVFASALIGAMAIYTPLDTTTAAIQSSINGAELNGGIVMLARNQTYTGTKITMKGGVHLDGNGATITQQAANNDHLIESTASISDVKITNLILNSNRANQSTGQGSNNHNAIQLENITGLTLERVTVKNCADVCFKLKGCDDVYANKCLADGYGVEGWSIAGCDDVQLIACSGINGDGVGGGGETGRGSPYAFEIEDEDGTGTPGSQRVTLTACSAKNNTLGGGLNVRSHAGASSNVSDVKIVGFSSSGNLNAINSAADHVRIDNFVSRGDTNFLNFSGGTDFALAGFSATGLLGRGVVVAGTIEDVSVSNGKIESVDNCWRHNGGAVYTNVTFSNVSMTATTGEAIYLSGTGDLGMYGSKKITADNTTATFNVVSSATVDLVIDGPVIETTRSEDNTDVFFWDTVNGSLRFNSGKLRCTDGDYVTSLFRLRSAAADQDVELQKVTFESDANEVIGVYAPTAGTDRIQIDICRFTANVSRAVWANGDNWSVRNSVFIGMAIAMRWFSGGDAIVTSNQFINVTTVFQSAVPTGEIDNNIGYP